MAVRRVKGDATPQRWSTIPVVYLAMLVPFVLFEALARDVHTHMPARAWDVAVLHAIHRHATPVRDRAAVIVSQIGGGVGTAIAGAAVAAALFRRRRRREAQFVVVAIAGAHVLTWAAKIIFHRVRPHLWEPVGAYSGYAFPSGHASTSMAFALAMVLVAWPTRARWPVVVAAATLVALVGLARVYLGVHYPTDVVAGWLASTGLVVAARYVFGPRRPGEVDWMRS